MAKDVDLHCHEYNCIQLLYLHKSEEIVNH